MVNHKDLIASTKYGTGKNAFYCRPAVNLGFDLYFQASYYSILKGSLNNFQKCMEGWVTGSFTCVEFTLK